MQNRDQDELADPEALNASIHDVIALLESEIERLKASLDLVRGGAHPDRRALLREHVAALDERQDALEELKGLVDAATRALS